MVARRPGAALAGSVAYRSAGVSPAWPHTGAGTMPALPTGPQVPPRHRPSAATASLGKGSLGYT